MNHSKFKQQLIGRIGKDSTERPFICDGYPLDTELFIIGINPATKIEKRYFDFWKGDRFDKNSWDQHYKEVRSNEYYEISPTRRKIGTLVNNEFSKYRCLETNIYSTSSKSISQLKNEDKSNSQLLFLIDSIKPKILFLHGRNPERFIRKVFKTINVNFKKHSNINNSIYFPPQTLDYKYGKIAICAISHLRLTKKEIISSVALNLLLKYEN